jgi:O-antigen/teichoic acid export membrane protein
LYWIALYVPAGLFFQLATSVILGRGDTRSYNIAQLALAALTTIAIAIAATMAQAPAVFVAAFAGGNLVVAVAVLAFMSPGAPARWGFDAALFREGWSFAAKSFVVSVLGFLVLRTNVFLVQRFRGPEELGFYSVAMQFMDLISLAPASLAAVLFPALVKSQSAWSDTKRHAAIAVAAVGAACLALAVLVDPVIRLVFGASFLPARMPVLLLLPAAAFTAATTIFSQYLAATGLPVSVILAWAGSALVGLVSGLLLVPAFGANGASIGLSVACGTALALMAGLSLARSRRPAVDHLRTA